MMTTMLLLRRVSMATILVIVVAVAALLATGRVAYVSTVGTSMLPTYEPGDLVLVVQSDDYAVGQNVMYRDPGSGVVALHRITGGDADGFVLRGDNNQSDDPYEPRADEVIGRQLLHVPALGGLLASTLLRSTLVLGLLSVMGTLLMSPRHRHSTEPSPSQPASSPTAIRGTDHRPGRPRRILFGVLLVTVALLVPAVALSFAFAERPMPTDPANDSITLTGSFGYRADARVSETYPEGVAVTGDPVFRQLADVLDTTVTVTPTRAVAGLQGSGRLDLELDGASGWSTRITLVDDTALVDGTLTFRTPVHLDNIDERVQRVTDETGLPMTPVNVRLVARLDLTRGSEPMEPAEMAAAFQLTGPVLRLSGPAAETPRGDAVTVTDTISPTQPTPPAMRAGVPAQIRLGLLIGLLLALGAVVLVWPSRPAHGAQRVRVRTASVPHSTAMIELTDHVDLEAIADRHNCPVMVRDDGWEGVATAAATYWVHADIVGIDTSSLDHSVAEWSNAPFTFPPPHPPATV